MASQAVPGEASVVVIGGGVMGCSTLYHLAGLGVTDAILLERNKLTSGTTWHSAAQVRALRSSRNMTDLIRYSISLYSRLEQETGQAVGWINEGSLSIATSADRLTHVRRQESLAHMFGVDAEFVSAQEALARWPLMNVDDVVGAVWSPDDGRVSPSDLCAALGKGARARGARIFEDTPVVGILTRNGRVVGVETEHGTVRCEAVAICTGLWSRRVGAMAGAAIPLYPCEHYYLLTNPIDGIEGNLPTLSDHDSHLYMRDDSGGLLVGCFEPNARSIAPERLGEDFAFSLLPEDWDHFEPMMRNALHRLPPLADAGVRMLLNGPESFTPDNAFMLGESAETDGLFLGCGMNSVGIASGGGAGMALAHCIHEGHPPMDLHEVDPMRFPDCFNSAQVLAQRIPEVLGRHYEITYPHRQWGTARGLRKTPLHSRWAAAGAHFAQSAGWERPLYFCRGEASALTFGKPDWFDEVGREVGHAHEGAAVFEQSTFGKIEVTGPHAAALLERVCANRMDRKPGRAIYTTMLNERGGIESDCIAMRLGVGHYRLFVGTAALRRDLAQLRRASAGFDVRLADVTEAFAQIGLMGPRSVDVARAVGADGLLELDYFGVGEVAIAGIKAHAVRLSFVGEYGWELTIAAKYAPTVYDALRAAGAQPSGTLAQTSMRIEKQFLSYGHDVDTDMSPLQAGLAFSVAWETDFTGRAALLAQRDVPTDKRIVTLLFEADDSISPLGNEPVYHEGQVAGKTTSAAWGYRVGRPLALADMSLSAARRDGAAVEVDIAGARVPAKVLDGAAFDARGTRMRAT
jgi:glycine cleavage system aminomethyltransferase T/glycine/D-amino acid oxidase-like deaminating enzyme